LRDYFKFAPYLAKTRQTVAFCKNIQWDRILPHFVPTFVLFDKKGKAEVDFSGLLKKA